MKLNLQLSFIKVAFLIFSSAVSALAQVPSAGASESKANALLEKHKALKQELVQNPYRRPLVFESAETSNKVSSTVFAVLDSPFPIVSTALKTPDQWCEVLILHLNTKFCQANTQSINTSKLEVKIGKKTSQPLSETFSLDFLYQVTFASESYLAVQLKADKGPINTTDYQIAFQAIPLADGKTFINLRYSYDYGMAGKIAMQAYLSTLGRGKIGFTKIRSDTNPQYTSGMQGAVERNTMRYYLAIEAYLTSLKQVPAQQLDARLQHWFAATQEYPQQLYEIDRDSYLTMKKAELRRQQSFSNTQ